MGHFVQNKTLSYIINNDGILWKIEHSNPKETYSMISWYYYMQVNYLNPELNSQTKTINHPALYFNIEKFLNIGETS